MGLESLRDHPAEMPADLEDVIGVLDDARAEAHDAAKALEKAISMLCCSDVIEAASKLSAAIVCLEEALEAAKKAASPMTQWADHASGDW